MTLAANASQSHEMDGLSGAASVIAVIDISAKIFELCQKYVSAVKEARKDIQSLRDGVTSLQDVLTDVRDLAEDPSSSRRSVFSRLNQHDGPVQQCDRDLRKLAAQLETGEGENKMRQFGLRALKWPFSTKDIEKRLQVINSHKTTFTLALTSDHFALTRTIKDDIARLGDGIADIQTEQRALAMGARQQKIRHWLSSPDPSSNHNAACKARQATTGEWFLNSDEFKEWKLSSRSFIWLYGIAGCGKSVLCSTVIEAVQSEYKSKNAVAIAYFYFDFNDTDKQGHEKSTRSLVEQLAWQSVKAFDCLESLFTHCQDGRQQPSQDALELTLQQMLDKFEETFIILDALDECKGREELLLQLKNLNSWGTEKQHLFATSRRERDIEQTLESLVTSEICLQGALVNVDIHTYVSELLQNDSKLKRWPANVRGEIEQTLVDGAQGMFRWVVCQVEVLRKCLELEALRKVLKSLPKTLEETYARILVNIDEECSDDAVRILQWLVYSARPLRIEEVAEIIAIDAVESRFDPENRLLEPRDLLTICSSLVTTVTLAVEVDKGVYNETTELRLAHFSVKEYLISDQIQKWTVFQYDIQSRAEEEIAQTCLIYLLHFQKDTLTSGNLNKFPLAQYAARYWCHHFRAIKDQDQATKLSMQLFEGDAFMNWIRIFDPDTPWNGPDIEMNIREIASPLYYMSSEGFLGLVSRLLEQGADVNARGGKYGNAIQVASIKGHEAIVALLLNAGADRNARGGEYGTALEEASRNGYKEIVALLLEAGADVNAQSGTYGNSLQAASINGYEAIVSLLLEAGADVNAQGGKYGTALQEASFGGHEATLALLLEAGADVNAQGGTYGTALQEASVGGYEAIVALLLEAGADVNADCGGYGSPLQAASYYGFQAIVALLLKKGADVNAQGGTYGNALEAASINGYEPIIALLLEAGANVNAQSAAFGTALYTASYHGCEAIVVLLLKAGADLNARSRVYGTPLQAASFRGHKAIVTLLLQAGADVNAQDGLHGTALQAASYAGYEAIVVLLLEAGAEVNAHDRTYGTALQVASYEGRKAIVALLLNARADVNAQCRLYGTALQSASYQGHEAIVPLLLEAGANMNAQHEEYGTPLQVASARGQKEIVALLLEARADVNAQGGTYGNALQAASINGYEAIVVLLLEAGAHVNAQGGE